MPTKTFLALGILLTPAVTNAQNATITSFANGLADFITGPLFTFLLALGFIFFAVNVTRYFIINSDDEEGRRSAKALALYGVTGFVIILIFWGIVNLLVNGLGLARSNDCIPASDYFFGEGCIGQPSTPDTEGPQLSAGDDSGFGSGTGVEDSGMDSSGSSDESVGDTNSPSGLLQPDTSEEERLYNEKETTEQELRESTRDDIDTLAGDTGALGINKDALVEGGVFADLNASEAETGFNDLERLQAAYRLNQLGVVSDEEFTAYKDAVNAYRNEQIGGAGTITTEDIQDIAIPQSEWPGGFVTNHENMKTKVENELRSYNEQAANFGNPQLSDSEIAEKVRSVSDFDLPYETRENNIHDLYGDNGGPIYLQDDTIYDSFIQEQNTERLLKNDSLDEIN